MTITANDTLSDVFQETEGQCGYNTNPQPR